MKLLQYTLILLLSLTTRSLSVEFDINKEREKFISANLFTIEARCNGANSHNVKSGLGSLLSNYGNAIIAIAAHTINFRKQSCETITIVATPAALLRNPMQADVELKIFDNQKEFEASNDRFLHGNFDEDWALIEFENELQTDEKNQILVLDADSVDKVIAHFELRGKDLHFVNRDGGETNHRESYYESQNGIWLKFPGATESGDSGSPIYDIDGAFVGLYKGRPDVRHKDDDKAFSNAFVPVNLFIDKLKKYNSSHGEKINFYVSETTEESCSEYDLICGLGFLD